MLSVRYGALQPYWMVSVCFSQVSCCILSLFLTVASHSVKIVYTNLSIIPFARYPFVTPSATHLLDIIWGVKTHIKY